jgi:hypothetical protein
VVIVASFKVSQIGDRSINVVCEIKCGNRIAQISF